MDKKTLTTKQRTGERLNNRAQRTQVNMGLLCLVCPPPPPPPPPQIEGFSLVHGHPHIIQLYGAHIIPTSLEDRVGVAQLTFPPPSITISLSPTPSLSPLLSPLLPPLAVYSDGVCTVLSGKRYNTHRHTHTHTDTHTHTHTHTHTAVLHEKRDLSYSVNQVMNWSLQMVKALEFVHKKDVLHRDIKPSK